MCDVTQEDHVQGLVDAAVAEHGRIDVMVNNAGLGGTANLVDMTDEQWNVVLDVTLNGTFRCTRAALRHMCPRGAGVIVNNASVLGWRAQAGQAHYAAAKAGVMALTRCAAMEGAEFGVRVNAVAPSLAMHQFLAKVTSEELLDELTKVEAFGRAAEPWEIATVIAFLASDYSTYMTGEIVERQQPAPLTPTPWSDSPRLLERLRGRGRDPPFADRRGTSAGGVLGGRGVEVGGALAAAVDDDRRAVDVAGHR